MSDLISKSMDVLKREGVSSLVKHASHYINKKRASKPKMDGFKDVLFINGCPRDTHLLLIVPFDESRDNEEDGVINL